MFLTDDDLRRLTGKKWRSKQIAVLRRMGVPFRVNAAGVPIVARAAIEGRAEAHQPAPRWEPAT